MSPLPASDLLLSALPKGPFARLAELLKPIEPGKAPISLAVGDPSGSVPPVVKTALESALASFGTYPAITGTEIWRGAACAWLNRRFALNGAVDPARNLLPLAGTREGLFSALFPLMPHTKAGAQPIVAMPNPFYQCYAAAALAAGAKPLYVPAYKENGFLPDYAGLPEETLNRLVAVYICSPSNPEGALADAAYWHNLFALADKYDFVVLADECYADIWFDTPPLSALTARLAQQDNLRRLLSFHSLSKRSGLPGLRSGLVAGDAALIEKLRAFRNVAGPTVPGPILAASAALWGDEAHVEAGRAAYQEKMAAAQRILGARMTRPGGGFFLWLDVGDGVAFAKRAWAEQGIRLLPGAFMGRDVFDGRAGRSSASLRVAGRSEAQENSQSNPGFSYVRVALVRDLSTIVTALERLTKVL